MFSRDHLVVRGKGGTSTETVVACVSFDPRPHLVDCGGIIGLMKHRDPARHPGVWRVMQVDSEWASVLIAAGFVLMGLVSLPIAKWFFLGAIVVGVTVALVLRLTKSEPPQSIGLGSQPEAESGPTSAQPSSAGSRVKSGVDRSRPCLNASPA